MIVSLTAGVFDKLSLTYLHVMLWLHMNKAFVHCVGAMFSLSSFVACATGSSTTKGHPGSLSCKHGQFIHRNL